MDISLFITVAFGFTGVIACQIVGVRQRTRIEASNEHIEASLKRIEAGITETRQVQQDIRMDTAVLADRVPRDFETRAQGGRGS